MEKNCRNEDYQHELPRREVGLASVRRNAINLLRQRRMSIMSMDSNSSDGIDNAIPLNGKRSPSFDVSCIPTEDELDPNRIYEARLVNKFGQKGNTGGDLSDATHIKHIYNGTIVVTDKLNNRLKIFTNTGRFKQEIPTGEGSHPFSATLTPSGALVAALMGSNELFITNLKGSHQIHMRNNDLDCPSGLVSNEDGNLLVCDSKINYVLMLGPGGRTIGQLAGNYGGFDNPSYVTLCKFSKQILISDSGNHCVKIFDKNGNFVKKFGQYGRGPGQFRSPYGICTDNVGRIIVADHYNNRLCMFSKDGEFMQNLLSSERGVVRPQGVDVSCGKINTTLYVTHGGLKAYHVSVFHLRDPLFDDVTINVSSEV